MQDGPLGNTENRHEGQHGELEISVAIAEGNWRRTVSERSLPSSIVALFRCLCNTPDNTNCSDFLEPQIVGRPMTRSWNVRPNKLGSYIKGRMTISSR